MRIFLLFVLASCPLAQSVPADRLTFSGGWSRQWSDNSYTATATGLGVSYGRRLHKFIEPEVGVFMALDPTGEICGRIGCFDAEDRYYWVPFGVRFVAPLGRIELSAGGGGLYEKYTVGNSHPGGGPYSRNGWGGCFVGSAAVEFDRGRHFWLGATPRMFLANAQGARDRWLQFSGELSVRFR